MDSPSICPNCASPKVERLLPTSFIALRTREKREGNIPLNPKNHYTGNAIVVKGDLRRGMEPATIQGVTIEGGGTGTGIKVDKNAYLKGKDIKISNMGVALDYEPNSDISIDGLDIG